MNYTIPLLLFRLLFSVNVCHFAIVIFGIHVVINFYCFFYFLMTFSIIFALAWDWMLYVVSVWNFGKRGQKAIVWQCWSTVWWWHSVGDGRISTEFLPSLLAGVWAELSVLVCRVVVAISLLFSCCCLTSRYGTVILSLHSGSFSGLMSYIDIDVTILLTGNVFRYKACFAAVLFCAVGRNSCWLQIILPYIAFCITWLNCL